MRIVVCGSYADMESFGDLLQQVKKKFPSAEVFPDSCHIEKSRPCIIAHHVNHSETEETIALRSELMDIYFRNIDAAEIVIIKNEKSGQEYYGIGTTIELGYAVANGKTILFTKQPTNPNICSLFKKAPKQSVIRLLK